MFLHSRDQGLTFSLPDRGNLDTSTSGKSGGNRVKAGKVEREHREAHAVGGSPQPVRGSIHVIRVPMSRWTRSRAKRVFDIAVVLAMLPVFAPLCLLIAIAIRASSRGPVLFRQLRAGAGGSLFSIVKFRTMVHVGRPRKGFITTIDDEQITALGRVLRYWKLDELPQLWNVLRGDMSLVGPRPRVPEQQRVELRCRPGITGAASLAFAREEVLLAGIPRDHLDTFYAGRVLPLKQRMDDAYMAQATLFSDVKLLGKTAATVWAAAGDPDLPGPLAAEATAIEGRVLSEECCD